MVRLNMVCVAAFMCCGAFFFQSAWAGPLEKRSPQQVPTVLPGANGGGIQPTSSAQIIPANGRPITGQNGGGIRPQEELPRPGANGGGIAPTTQKAVTLPAKVPARPGANGGGRPPTGDKQTRPFVDPIPNDAKLPTAQQASRVQRSPQLPGGNGGGRPPVGGAGNNVKPWNGGNQQLQNRPQVLPHRNW